MTQPGRRRALRRLGGHLVWPWLAACQARESRAGGESPLFGTPPKALALQGRRTVTWADWLGVNVMWPWLTPEAMRVQSASLQALGLKWTRLPLHWMLAEPQPGQWALDGFDQALGHIQGLGWPTLVYVLGSPAFASAAPAGATAVDTYPPLDPQALAQRLVQLAARYPSVGAWQVWNEPNLPAFWAPQPDAAGYARLLDVCSQALRALRPAPQVAAAGLAYFGEQPGQSQLMGDALARAGAYLHGEVACYHPYTAEPEGAAGDARDLIDKLAFVNQGLRAQGVQQIWATEWGWSSYEAPPIEQPIVGEDGQADHVIKRLMLMATQDFDRSFLFALSDLDDARINRRDQSYGLLRVNGEPKPAYTALARLLQATGPRLSPLPVPPIEGGLPAGLVHMAWLREDGRAVWVAWAHEAMAVNVLGRPAGVWLSPMSGQQQAVAAGAVLPVDTELRVFVSDAPWKG